MKFVIQRADHASVWVQEEKVGEIENGLVVFACFEKNDREEQIEKAASKILNLRIFPSPGDETPKMNLNIKQVQGQVLAISQFTLSWDGGRGNRPSFDNSMEPQKARLFFDLFCKQLHQEVGVSKGVFGAYMKVLVNNDGPVTFSLNF